MIMKGHGNATVPFIPERIDMRGQVCWDHGVFLRTKVLAGNADGRPRGEIGEVGLNYAQDFTTGFRRFLGSRHKGRAAHPGLSPISS